MAGGNPIHGLSSCVKVHRQKAQLGTTFPSQLYKVYTVPLPYYQSVPDYSLALWLLAPSSYAFMLHTQTTFGQPVSLHGGGGGGPGTVHGGTQPEWVSNGDAAATGKKERKKERL